MMSKESKQDLFKIFAFLLGYPEGTDFWNGIEELKSYIESIADSTIKSFLLHTLEVWNACHPNDLRREYIQTFDFRETTCLYLTAHEYGDSRERGVALIELQRLLRECGYEVLATELPDYLPLVFELLAVKPADVQTDELENRMAHVCHRILDHLGSNSSYNGLFCAILATLPQVRYEGETTSFPKRQHADLDPLPYPLNFSK